ncbi:hypothetical protein Hamer_G024035 [Homarus americanus]|uniref:Uncharacterized protein n=1 Tax=Homarus americanus TaxID=6706 RepID=A0A8J5N5E5_HOMAM|nr:hypothetical protein Hamer_G024035 [Homarus americanus]
MFTSTKDRVKKNVLVVVVLCGTERINGFRYNSFGRFWEVLGGLGDSWRFLEWEGKCQGHVLGKYQGNEVLGSTRGHVLGKYQGHEVLGGKSLRRKERRRKRGGGGKERRGKEGGNKDEGRGERRGEAQTPTRTCLKGNVMSVVWCGWVWFGVAWWGLVWLGVAWGQGDGVVGVERGRERREKVRHSEKQKTED